MIPGHDTVEQHRNRRAIRPRWQAGRWKQLLSEAVTDPLELLAALGLEPAGLMAAGLEISGQAPMGFGLRVPRGFIARMGRGDPADPLLMQVLPAARELDSSSGFVTDPLREAAVEMARGTLHKYAGRVLLVVTGACAVHCRYCFRRHFPYSGKQVAAAWDEALTYIADDTSVEEVILSGGDPLAVPDSVLADLVRLLGEIPHLRRLRIHTRLPIVLPERVDQHLLSWLEDSRLSPVVVVHANHAAELDADVEHAIDLLRSSGVTTLNQSVLLAGINDSADVLAELSTRLFEIGVLPYYLHMLDSVQGAAHFEVDEARALELMGELRQRLPGYLVPRLVREEPGAPAKTVLKA